MCKVKFVDGPYDGEVDEYSGFAAPETFSREYFGRGKFEVQTYTLASFEQKEHKRSGAWPVVWWEAIYKYIGPSLNWPGGEYVTA